MRPGRSATSHLPVSPLIGFFVLSPAAHTVVFVIILAVFLTGMIAIVAFADHRPRRDDEDSDSQYQPGEPGHVPLAA